jgi:hypothetical protein
MALTYNMRALAAIDNDYVFWSSSNADADGSEAPETIVDGSATIVSISGEAEGGTSLPDARPATETDHEIVLHLNETSGPFSNTGNTSSSDWTIEDGTVTPNQEGIIDKSVLFDGSTNSRISAPTTSDLTGWTEGTGMIWFKTTIEDHGTWAFLFLKEHDNWVDVTFGIGIAGDTNDIGSSGATSLIYRINDNQRRVYYPIFPDTWYHVALTTSATERKLYINGILVDNASGLTIDWTAGDDTYPWSLGGASTTNRRHFTGYLEDFRFVSRALSQSEIRQIIAPTRMNFWNNYL